ncbi:MAG: RNA methyltransferase [Bacteroidia bacterium]|nr:MAG: RNA methyltransferase [Bacteroidia bacterium]
MLSKKTIKLVHSLNLKKNRMLHGLFVAEGTKTIYDLLQTGMPLELLLVEQNHKDTILFSNYPCQAVSSEEIKKISNLKNTPPAIAIFKIPASKLRMSDLENKMSLFCDQIQDPGNLGTIIRTASWFGIENIICSSGTTDAYNPKTIQASMGAIAQVKIFYVKSKEFFSALPAHFPVYGTVLDGNNIFRQQFARHGLIVIGNEGHGISSLTDSYITHRISVPSFSSPGTSPESLNASAAAAIVCAEFCRQNSLLSN